MHLGRNAYAKLAAVVLFRQRHGHFFPRCTHVNDCLGNNATDTL